MIDIDIKTIPPGMAIQTEVRQVIKKYLITPGVDIPQNQILISNEVKNFYYIDYPETTNKKTVYLQKKYV